jgi:hypothetical protein
MHPVRNWLRYGGSYFDARVKEETCLTEPRPLPEAAEIDPAEYERVTREPRGFIALRLRPSWGNPWTTIRMDQ